MLPSDLKPEKFDSYPPEARKMYERSAKTGYPPAIAWCQKNGVSLDTTPPGG